MNVVFIVPSLREASARIRVSQVLPRLSMEGIDGRVLEIPGRSRPRWSFFRDLGRADVVVLHRKLFNFLEFAFLRRNARRLVFDFDDAVMVRDSFRRSPHSRRRMGRFLNAVRKADGVVAGNPYLMDRALEAGASGEVRVIPSPVDVTKYPKPRPARGGSKVLGWIGQRSTLPYLEDLLPTLETMALEDHAIRLRVVSDAFPSTGGIPLDRKSWSEETEAELLAGTDIGLMPLRDDPWSRGKCGYKILQFFAARKPVVASPVGMNVALVRPGITGFLAEEPRDWAGAISELLADPSKRTEMGATGYRLLEKGGFTLEEYAKNLGSFLRNL